MSETLTNGQSEWTPDKDAAIREGFEKGLSARVIADQLGVTRNAILGRAYRMRIGGSVLLFHPPSPRAIRLALFFPRNSSPTCL